MSENMQTKFETVATGQTAQVLGATGSVGDYLERLIITVSTSASSTVALLDNATSVSILAANTPIGIYCVDFQMRSVSGAWKITTGAGASVIAVGQFS